MNDSEILARVDHTLLNPAASWAEIERLCNEAVLYKTASVCVPPSYVRRIKNNFSELTICTVIGFPAGYHSTELKICEINLTMADGASEFDAVINLGDVKNGDYISITEEIKELKKAARNNILKVIIETCMLNEDEKIRLCDCVTEGGADYIKTSTGFGSAGAVLSDIELMKRHIGAHVKIKAAGGIRTRGDMLAFLDAGCDRLGSSSAVKILTGM